MPVTKHRSRGLAGRPRRVPVVVAAATDTHDGAAAVRSDHDLLPWCSSWSPPPRSLPGVVDDSRRTSLRIGMCFGVVRREGARADAIFRRNVAGSDRTRYRGIRRRRGAPSRGRQRARGGSGVEPSVVPSRGGKVRLGASHCRRINSDWLGHESRIVDLSRSGAHRDHPGRGHSSPHPFSKRPEHQPRSNVSVKAGPWSVGGIADDPIGVRRAPAAAASAEQRHSDCDCVRHD